MYLGRAAPLFLGMALRGKRHRLGVAGALMLVAATAHTGCGSDVSADPPGQGSPDADVPVFAYPVTDEIGPSVPTPTGGESPELDFPLPNPTLPDWERSERYPSNPHTTDPLAPGGRRSVPVVPRRPPFRPPVFRIR